MLAKNYSPEFNFSKLYARGPGVPPANITRKMRVPQAATKTKMPATSRATNPD
jgi:hypothetical protein